jgi:hypothetical protein
VTTATRYLEEQEKLLDIVGFTPHPEQRAIIESRKRDILVAGGSRAGKSKLASAKAFLNILEEEPDLYWLVAEDYERTRAEFDYLTEFFAKLGVITSVSKVINPGRIELADGTIIETKSAKDPRTLVMKAPKGIIVCEASQVDLETFNRCHERLMEKRGWLFLSGTFEPGSLGWYPQTHRAWLAGDGEAQSFSLPTTSNITVFPGGSQDPEILRLKRESSDDFFLERIMGVPVPPKGRVFPEFRPDVNVRSLEWEPGNTVYVWVDPGYAGAHAVECVQIIDGQIRLFDEIYEVGLITDDIIDKVVNRPWWKEAEKRGVIDIAGWAHQAMAAPAEVWLQKAGLFMSSNKVNINDGTERLKSFLKINPSTMLPWLVVDPSCKGFLSELGVCSSPIDGMDHVYQWKLDREGGIVGSTPDDKFNHAVKAVIYGLVEHFGYVNSQVSKVIKVGRWR